MAEYMLHCFAQSGNAYKPALALELAGADWAPRFVDYFNGETRTPGVSRDQRHGRGAGARAPRRACCRQSGVILDYLAETLGQFGPADDAERREILRWLLFDNHKLTSYTATYRFMRAFVKDPDPAVLAEFRRRAETAWGVLDAHLERRRYVVARPADDRRSLAVGYLFFDDEIGVDWSVYPAIRDWLARIRSEPRWVHPYELMPGIRCRLT